MERRCTTALCSLLLISVAVAGWLPEERLTDSTMANRTSAVNAHCVAADRAGNVHVVWHRSATGYGVHYECWDASTSLWSPDVELSPTASDACNPAIAVDDSGGVHVVWQTGSTGTAILYRFRAAGGEWGAVETVTTMPSAASPSIAVRGPVLVAVAWQGTPAGRAATVFYAGRDVSGWSVPETVSASSTVTQAKSSVGVDSQGNVSVLWVSNTSLGRVVCRTRDGSGWLEADTLLRGYSCAVEPSLAVSPDGTVHALCRMSVQTSDLRLVYRQRRGGVWQDSVWLPRPYRTQEPGSIAVDDSGRPHVAWCAESGRTQVYHASSDALGQSWPTIDTLTAVTRYNRHNPSVSTGPDGSAQVVWYDERGGSTHPTIYCRRYYPRLRDVAVSGFGTSPATVDSGFVFVPSCWLRNVGDSAEFDVPVRFVGAGDSAFVTIASIATGESVRVQFDSCRALRRGWSGVRCSTFVAGDVNRSNNVLRESTFVRVLDAGVVGIVVPEDTVTQAMLTPSVRLRNQGNAAALASVVLVITDGTSETDTTYEDSMVVALGPGRDTTVVFAAWATTPGGHVARCSVSCEHDLHPENDTMSRRFVVVRRDVGVRDVLWPTGIVDSTATGQPRARVRNFGTEVESFDAVMVIGGSYADTASVVMLGAGDSVDVLFAEWQPTQRGNVVVRCSTLLTGDSAPGNDCRTCSVFVRVSDAAAVEIVRPVEVISRGSIVPAAVVANRGDEVAQFSAVFLILDGTNGTDTTYEDTATVELGPGADTVLEFARWDVTESGEFRAVCMTNLGDDMQRANDTVTSEFRVPAIDAAMRAIVSPADTVGEGSVEPLLTVANLGEEAADMCGGLSIGAYYRETLRVVVAPQVETTLALPAWHATPGGCDVSAWVRLADDGNPANDTLRTRVVVESVVVRRWMELASIPSGPSRRGVRGGGCMAALGDGAIALKGGNSGECYRYFAAGDSWHLSASLPPGLSGRGVRYGSALSSDGSGGVFALKGNHTREFWRYDLAVDSWSALPSAPDYTTPFRCGAAMAFVPGDTGRLFVMKGSGTGEFLVFWTGLQQWHARRPLPGRGARHGSALALVGSRIFGLKGGTNEFYEYLPAPDSWRVRDSIPLINAAGRSRRAKRGAALASDGTRYCYAFKGGGSSDFWRYDAQLDRWDQIEDIPRGAARRRVAMGGALAWMGGRVLALKGDNCREFWAYDPDAAFADGVRPERDGVQAAPALGRMGLMGPIRPMAERTYDATGRVVRSGGRRPGVYFVRTEQDGVTRVVKVIVPR